MNELALKENNNQVAEPKPKVMAGGGVKALVPQNIEECYRVAEALYQSGMAPKELNSPQKVMACIMQGAEVGFAPMQSLKNIAVINGKPTIFGDGLMALARRKGNQVEENMDGNGDLRTAFCRVTRSDTGEVIERTFSVADAKKAHLWGKRGPWSDYPDRMLRMRARAFAVRDGLADQLAGLEIAEEVRDIPEKSTTPVPETANRLQRRLGTNVDAESEDKNVLETCDDVETDRSATDTEQETKRELQAPNIDQAGLTAALNGTESLAIWWEGLTDAERTQMAESYDTKLSPIAFQSDQSGENEAA